MSSTRTTAQPNDQHAAGSSCKPNEFVNQGKKRFSCVCVIYWLPIKDL